MRLTGLLPRRRAEADFAAELEAHVAMHTEDGIRAGLSAEEARRRALERLVLRQGLALALIAVALGWPVAWMLAKLSASLLYGVQAHDALTFAAVPALLIAIALAACWIPARRAASVDPMQALREE